MLIFLESSKNGKSLQKSDFYNYIHQINYLMEISNSKLTSELELIEIFYLYIISMT